MVFGTTSNSGHYSTSESVNIETARTKFHWAPLAYDPDFYCWIPTKTHIISAFFQQRWRYLRNVLRHCDASRKGRGCGHLRPSAAKFKRWKKEPKWSAAETQEEAQGNASGTLDSSSSSLCFLYLKSRLFCVNWG